MSPARIRNREAIHRSQQPAIRSEPRCRHTRDPREPLPQIPTSGTGPARGGACVGRTCTRRGLRGAGPAWGGACGRREGRGAVFGGWNLAACLRGGARRAGKSVWRPEPRAHAYGLRGRECWAGPDWAGPSGERGDWFVNSGWRAADLFQNAGKRGGAGCRERGGP